MFATVIPSIAPLPSHPAEKPTAATSSQYPRVAPSQYRVSQSVSSAGRRVKLNRYRSGLLVRSLVVIGETTSLAPTVDDARRVAEVLPGSVLLFGSVARGDATPGSDINCGGGTG